MEETLGDESRPAAARPKWWIAVLAAAVVIAAAGIAVAMSDRGASDDCGASVKTLDDVDYPEAVVTITPAGGKTKKLCVLVANTRTRREHGLMGVRDLGRHDGMVFVYPDDNTQPFWMKNTVMPLSIAWFRGDGSFVSSTDMEPCTTNDSSCPLYAPDGPYRYALEVPRGELDDWGVSTGATLTLQRQTRR